MPILYYFYPKFSNPGSGTGCWVWRPWRPAAVSCALVESWAGGAGICGATATVASCAGVVSCTRICGATATEDATLAQGYVAPPQHQAPQAQALHPQAQALQQQAQALHPQAQALQQQAQALQPQAQALKHQPQALQTPPHPHPQEEVLEKAVLVEPEEEPEEEPEAQAAIPPLAPLILSPRPSAGRRRPVAPRERPGRPYPALGTPRLSLPPNAIEVSQWPQLPTKELQSHFDGNGRQWTTAPYQCWMCWQRCGHPFKARRHTCLASSLTYSCPYCPFSSVVKNPSGHRAKCEGDGVTAYFLFIYIYYISLFIIYYFYLYMYL